MDEYFNFCQLQLSECVHDFDTCLRICLLLHAGFALTQSRVCLDPLFLKGNPDNLL